MGLLTDSHPVPDLATPRSSSEPEIPDRMAEQTASAPSSGPDELSNADLLKIYRTLRLSRAVDERMWILNRQGRAPFVISCQGHEGAQVGSAWALRAGVDNAFPYYRDVGVVLTLGMTARDLMLAFFAKAADPASGGRQMPNHFGSFQRRIFTGSSPVATQVVQAAGVALASKIRHEDAVTVAYMGEGSTASGHFHEGLNFASIHHLPMILVVENNQWAISVPSTKEMPVKSVAERAGAYNIPGISVDGTDVLAVYRVVRQAAQRARTGGGPTLIDAHTYRFTPHSSDDDDRYRPAEERERAKHHDPIDRFRNFLFERDLLDQAMDADIVASVRAEVDDAVSFAEQSPDPDPATLIDNLYAS